MVAHNNDMLLNGRRRCYIGFERHSGCGCDAKEDEMGIFGAKQATYSPDPLLVERLEFIGEFKNRSPLATKGIFNILGLYVQRHGLMGVERLDAGSSPNRSSFAATRDREDRQWKIKKYEPGEWEKLVEPTLEIADWMTTLKKFEEDEWEILKQAAGQFKKTGVLGLVRD